MRRWELAAFAIALALPAVASAWGWQGHKLITQLAVDRLPAEIRAVYAPQMARLLEETVQPDKKVFSDPREGPKHFLNVEVLDPTYRAAWEKAGPDLKAKPHHTKRAHTADSTVPPTEEEGAHTPALQLAVFEGRLPVKSDEADALYARIPVTFEAYHALSEAYQKELGSVVYQPAHYYAELVKAFRSGDPARIVGVTGYLSHYCGDLHVPLHNTIDHEGGFSKSPRANKGMNATVHSRFESGFLKFLGNALPNMAANLVKAPTLQPAAGIQARALREAREAYTLYPQVISVDKAIMAKHTGKTVQWKRFYGEFEPQMAPIVAGQLARSAQMLADLIVSAWDEAKKSPRQ